MTNKLLYVNIINPDDICIETLSFSPCGQYLAASYGTNIAIYEVRSNFLLTTLIDNDPDASFRSILWIPFKKTDYFHLSDYRLFTVGLHGIITEWDLNLFRKKNSCTSYGGAIFSGVISPTSDLLVACDDGYVRSFSVWDSYQSPDRIPELNFKKVHVRHNKRILSICCVSDGRFFCGTSDSLILICHLDNENYSSLIRVSPKKVAKRVTNDSEEGEEEEVKEEETVHVWCLAFIKSRNTIASGDSDGNVILWDASTYTMLQMFTQHNSDVIALTLFNEDTLFSAGLDSKVTLYTNSSTNSHFYNYGDLYLNNFKDIESYLNSKSRDGWSVNGFKYPLKGDIRTLSSNPTHGLVASAGNFGCISICKGLNFLSHKKSKYKLVYPDISPFNPIISTNSHKNLALCRYPYHFDLWYLPTSTDSGLYGDCSPKNSKKSDPDLTNDKLSSEIPYKLCTMNMNKTKGKIKSFCLSPEGDVVAISNDFGLRILMVDLADLKISQIKFDYPDLCVMSMVFLSNSELIINHYRDRFLVSLYNIKDGTLEDLDYLNFHKHVIKIAIYHNNPDKELMNGCHKVNKGALNSVNIENGDSPDENINREYRFGVFYCLDGTVYLSDLVARTYVKLPQFEGGSRVCSVAFSDSWRYLVAFSTTFKYYFYDVLERTILSYEDRFIHPVSSKVVNSNSVIANSFWISNIVVVHTTYNIFYFKLLKQPFYRSGSGTTVNDSTTNPNTDTEHSLSTPDPDTHRYNNDGNSDNQKSPGSGYTERKKISFLPRRLYQVPSIDNALYDPYEEADSGKLDKNHTGPETDKPDSNSNNNLDHSEHGRSSENEDIGNNSKIIKYSDKSTSKYTNIVKSKFIVHSDFLVRDDHVNIIAFRSTLREEIMRNKRYGN